MDVYPSTVTQDASQKNFTIKGTIYYVYVMSMVVIPIFANTAVDQDDTTQKWLSTENSVISITNNGN